MFTQSDDIAAEVERRYPAQIAALRADACRAAREGPEPVMDLVSHQKREFWLTGPALSVPEVGVAIDAGHLDVTDLANFESRRVVGLLVEAWGHPLEQAVRPALGFAIPETEARGWVRAALGAEWAAHAWVLRDIGGDLAHVYRVLTLLDQDCRVVAVPPEFFFGFFATRPAVRPDQVMVRRLLPDPETGMGTDEFLAPKSRDESLLWPIEVSGEILPKVRAAVDALINLLRPKGTLGHDFRPVSLHVQGRIATIGFLWIGADRYSEETLSLPTEEDFSAESAFHRRSYPRLPTPPRRAAEWAGQLDTIFSEKIATGTMGAMYDHPELRAQMFPELVDP